MPSAPFIYIFSGRPSAALTAILCLKIMARHVPHVTPAGGLCIFLTSLLIATSAASASRGPGFGPAERKALQLRLRRANAQIPAVGDLVQRDRLRWRPRRSALRPTAMDMPLSSDSPFGAAEYVAEIEIGTPPTKAHLVVDTASNLVWVKCRYDASERGYYFNAKASSTFEPVPCGAEDCRLLSPTGCTARSHGLCAYKYSYADGTVAAGILSRDAVRINGVVVNRTFEGVTSNRLLFGCTESAAGDSFQGVLGLGRRHTSFLSQVGPQLGWKFSYCFVDHLRSATASSSLVIGNREFSASERRGLKSTTIQSDPNFPSFYYLDVRGLSVDGRDLSIPDAAWQVRNDGTGGTIIDSGTSLTYLRTPVFEKVFRAFDRLLPYPRVNTSDPFPLCFEDAGVKKPYPELAIAFSGRAVFKPPANNYIFKTAAGVSCLAILEAPGDNAMNIIGNILQQNFIVQFDMVLTRLQFTPTDCSKH